MTARLNTRKVSFQSVSRTRTTWTFYFGIFITNAIERTMEECRSWKERTRKGHKSRRHRSGRLVSAFRFPRKSRSDRILRSCVSLIRSLLMRDIEQLAFFPLLFIYRFISRIEFLDMISSSLIFILYSSRDISKANESLYIFSKDLMTC